MHWHRSRYTRLTFLYQGSEGMKRMTSLRSKKENARHWARIRIYICGHRKAIRTAGAEKEHSVLVAHDMRKSRVKHTCNIPNGSETCRLKVGTTESGLEIRYNADCIITMDNHIR